ncbi:YafY family protein [Thioclava sp. A2]|uniref:helix-turn-helix transcriptional regulator n=1 Tax=Thioclava sp. FCG-A2 TaxID=3080562 RepID=UPI00295490C6|nr:YafY family protein [Thioclava sp. A2]MDV7269439.1 YafY family protein [Thioclava sp. A2]
MRRTERLFQIIQILRSRKAPVTGRALADELEVSLRTLYRDMAELVAQRVPIRGEAGTGYVLDQGYDLPPLMLTIDELEVAALGAAWVAGQGDASLASAARDLVAKLASVAPPDLRPVVLDDALRPISFNKRAPERFDSRPLRCAIRERRKLLIHYADQAGDPSERVIWPLFLAFFDQARVVAAWCELRNDFRHFRTDRISSLTALEETYPKRRDDLIRRWKAQIVPVAERT